MATASTDVRGSYAPHPAGLAGGAQPAEGPRAAATWDPLPGNVCGRAQALTALSPLMWWGPLWLEFYFRVRRRFPRLGILMARPLRHLAFIYFARWALIDRLPHNPPAPPESLNHTYLLFESNFTGRWDEYIDAFSYVLGPRMSLMWGSAFGFPGPKPAEPFKRYIRQNEYEAGHYYSAIPEATTKMVCSALALAEPLAELARAAESLDAERFASRYRAFVTDVQRHL